MSSTPNPYDPVAEAAFKDGAITSFARHSRLGGTDLDSADAVTRRLS